MELENIREQKSREDLETKERKEAIEGMRSKRF
jgi:hypothetical protein